MSQQSNPATLRKAIAKAIWDNEIAELRLKGGIPKGVEYAQWPEDAAIQPYCKSTYRAADAVIAALAASGTEAAPCPECESRKRVHDLFERKWNKAVPEEVSVDEIMAAKEGPAKAAASPEGEGREAPLYTGELAAIDEELDEILGKRAADDVTSVLTRVHNALLRQSAAPSGGAALEIAKVALRNGSTWEERYNAYKVVDTALAQESKTGAAPSRSPLRNPSVRHGYDCVKVMHRPDRIGYLHGEYDDGPYDVDGVNYCGRCHLALPGETGAVTETK